MKPDRQEIFLRQFPGLSGHYRSNKELIRSNKNTLGFDILYGSWIRPSCCSMVVNVLMFYLTLQSIMLHKGDLQMYWLPDILKYELAYDFK
jgi:hypothetical protein